MIDDQNRIETYAEKLRQSGTLKRLTLRNIALDLHLWLVQKKTENYRQKLLEGEHISLDFATTITLTDDLLLPIEKYFQSAFNQEFWTASAQAILSRLDTESPGQPDDDLEFMLINSCGYVRAGEILRDFEAWDLSVEVLEGLFAPTPRKTASITEPRLCQTKFYENVPSSAVTDTIYTAGVIGMDFWGASETSLNGRKDFSKGRVELQIRDNFDLEEFAEIAYQAKEVIAQQFGEETLKLHYALSAIAFRKSAPWNDEIIVSASKLLADFGKDKKKNRYIPKSSREESGQSVGYVSKEDRLKQLAHQSRLLKRIEVWVPEWRVTKKRIFAVEMSNLWDIFSINEITQLSADGTHKIIDIEITYKPGIWFQKFAGDEYLKEYGYITSEVLKLDPVQDRMALRLAGFALSALRQHKSGRYQIRRILSSIGYKSEIETAKINAKTAWILERSFKRGLDTLGSFQHPYYFELDSDAPDWAKTGSKVQKPKGWFEIWVELSGTLRQPDLLPVPKDAFTESKQTGKRQNVRKSSEAFDPITFGQQVRQVRTERGETLTTMAKAVGISKTQLSQIENGRYPATINYQVKARILDYLGVSV